MKPFIVKVVTTNLDGTFTLSVDNPEVTSEDLLDFFNNRVDLDYHVYAGMDYYPYGGYEDYKGSFASEVEALKAVVTISQEGSIDWYQIVYRGQIVHATGQKPLQVKPPKQPPPPGWVDLEDLQSRDFGATFHD